MLKTIDIAKILQSQNIFLDFLFLVCINCVQVYYQVMFVKLHIEHICIGYKYKDGKPDIFQHTAEEA